MTGKHGTVEQRFWRHVTKSDDCWIWAKPAYPSGYGALKVQGAMRAAHRISWELHYGPIPDGLLVCHTCDTRLCVRPDHLWLGTNLENMADMRAKGRSVYSGGRPPKRLTDDDLLRAKEMIAKGMTQRKVAQEFGIAQATLSRNINGKTAGPRT